MMNWSQDEVQGQGKSEHQTPCGTLQQGSRNVEVQVTDGDVHGWQAGIDKETGSKDGADECQGVGEDKRVESIAPSKHWRACGGYRVAIVG
jgi:hypothetical protein